MRIKSVHIVSISFFILCFLICLLFCMNFAQIPELIKNTEKTYRILLTLKVFIYIMPAIFFTSSTVGWAIDFGSHSGNSLLRFSHAMFERYKGIVVTGMIFVAILTFAWELANPLISKKMKSLEELPSLMTEYQITAKNLYDAQNYELSYKYAKSAYLIDPKNTLNSTLVFKAESALNEKAKISKSIIQTMHELTFGDSMFGIPKKSMQIPTEPYESYKLLQTARECLENQDWFGAHYYSQQALKLADNKNVNITECKHIAATAWNMLSQAREYGTSEEQKIFAKKYEGYTALTNGDFLHSYYVFNTLSKESKYLAIDPDVVRYLRISQQALDNQYFYYDETFNLKGYETATNISFKIKNSLNGTTTVFFIKGVSSKGHAANMIQYLRALTIVTLSPEGEYLSGIYVPYAKMKNIETSMIDEEILENLEINKKIKNIPFVLLTSVDRNLEGLIYRPEKIGGSEKNTDINYLLMPISYEVFNTLKEASKGAESMPLTSLMDFYTYADRFGYSGEVFCQALMNRLLFPLYVLIFFVMIAITAWHCRINEDSIFKFHWIYIFILLCPIYISMHKLATGFFRAVNFSILGTFGSKYAFSMGFFLYALVLVLVSIGFLACHNAKNK